MEDILAIILIFGGGTAVCLAFSPVGRALADRIRGHGAVPVYDPEMVAELQSLRADVSELQERVDFTERLLARKAEPAQLAGPPDTE
jgi:hypothetical protein